MSVCFLNGTVAHRFRLSFIHLLSTQIFIFLDILFQSDAYSFFCMRFAHACSIYDIPGLNLSFLSSGLYTCAYTYVKHHARSHPPVFSLLNPCLLLSHLIPFSSSLAGPRRCRRAVVCIPSSAFRPVSVYTDNNAVYDILRSLTPPIPCHHKMRMEGK